MRRTTSSIDQELILELPSPSAWRAWLEENHARSGAIWLRLSKKGADKTITYAEALDAALAWGWIDSQKRTRDATAFEQRFGPRKADSPWSKINCAKVEALIAAGAMAAPGLAQVERAKRDGRWERAYDGARTASVPDDLAQALANNPRAEAFFATLDRGNRFAILYRVQTAKTETTRSERIARIVELCERNETLRPATATKRAPARAKR